MKEVILIGDSIRLGYEDYVRRELEGQATVWGPEQNGGTSANVLLHLEEWILDRSPAVVHLNCGLHDIATPFDSDQPRVALEQYTSNVGAVLSRLRAAGDCALIWASTTPVNEVWHHSNKGFDRFEEDVRSYNRAAAQVAADLDVPIDDLYNVVDAAGRDQLLKPDGVHFSDQGCALLGSALARFLAPHLDSA